MTPDRLEAVAAALTQDVMDRARVAITSPFTQWESALPEAPMTHFTGHFIEYDTRILWTIQLIVLDTQRIGTATQGVVVLKLTPELAELAESNARKFCAEIEKENAERRKFLEEIGP